MLEWKISISIPSSAAYLRICASYSGNVMVPKISVCTLRRMFMPAPWMIRIFVMVVVLSRALRLGRHAKLRRRFQGLIDHAIPLGGLDQARQLRRVRVRIDLEAQRYVGQAHRHR